MKRGFGLLLLTFAALSGLELNAQTTVWWDANGATAGVGGTGTWDTTTNNRWANTAAGSAFTGTGRWTNVTTTPNNAVFLGTAGTVTTNAAMQVGDITFGVSGYTLAASAANNIILGGSTDTTSTIDTGAFTATISGVLAGSATITKSGTGTLTLSGANTFTGSVVVSAGALNLQNASALGTTAGGVTVNSGAALQLQNTISIGAEALTLNGTGVSSNGALRNISGVNSYAGAITLGSDARINSDAGTLTLSGGVTGTQNLTLGGAGNTTVSGVIGTGTGTVTKDGAGTVIFSGNNTYSGTTTVSAGILQVGNAGTTGSVGTGAVVNNAAITFNRSNTQTITNAISGTGSITQSGAGTTILSGANSYAGTTTVSAGVLNIQNSTALGTVAGGTSVTAGAALEMQGGITVGAEALTLNGTGISSGGALRNISGTNSYAGAITLGSAARINSDAGTLTLSGGVTGTQNLTLGGAGDTTVSGVIGTGSGTLTKDGAGTVVLSAANTYSGTTTLSAGTLQIGAGGTAGSLGTGAVTNNANLSFNRSDTQTIANAISGTGSLTQAGSGTTILTGANGYSGSTTISAGVLQIGSGGTTGTLGTGSVVNNASLVFNRSDTRTISNSISGSGSITQAGTSTFGPNTGILSLTGANSFTGGATVNSGAILSVENATALGGGTVGTTVASGGALAFQSAGTMNISNNGTLTLSGTGLNNSGALYNSGGANTWLGNIALAGNTTINANAGTLYLGQDSTIANPYGSHTLVAPVDTHTLSLGSNTLTLGGSGTTIQVNSRITGTGNVIVDNAGGTVVYYPYFNTYTGTTTVKAGTLDLQTIDNQEPGNPTQGGFYGINGALIIGDGTGAALSATVKLGTSFNEVLNYTTPVSIKSDGRFLVQSIQTIKTLTFDGGTVDIPTAGGLYLDDTVTVNAATGNVSNINTTGSGQLSLTRHFGSGGGTNANRIFDIGDATSSTASDLNISAQIAAGSLTKNGTGTMTFNGTVANIYEGTTTINNGTLNIQKNTALGGATNTATDGTFVNSGGTLQLQNNITVSSENLYLNGTGYNLQGALNNISGNNTWAGAVELQSNARTTSDAGLLTLSGTVNTNTFTLDVRGASNTTISGSVTGSGGIEKNDAGTLILSGNNTFAGTTVVKAGVLSMQNNGALGGAGSTTVESGAALHLDSTANGNLNGGDATTNISGTGISGTGAIRNVLGANSYTGQVTLAADALITANSTTTLTLSGGTSATTQNLTVGTTAQNGNVVISGTIANGTGQLTKAGSGDLTFAKSTGVTGNIGATHLDAGTLTVGLDTGSLSTLNTGAIDSALGTTLKIGSSGKVVANYASGNTNMFGTIDEIAASGGIFEKTGAGTLTFNTSFNFAGNLILSGGTLALANSASVTFGNIYITADMTIDFGVGTSTILSSANLYIASGVKVTVVNWVNNGAGGSDDIWYATGGFNNYSGSTSAPTIGTSAVLDAIGAAPENQITFSGVAPAANTSWVTVQGGQYYDHEIRPIPEPSTYGALLLGGCLGFVGWRRFRRNANTRR